MRRNYFIVLVICSLTLSCHGNQEKKTSNKIQRKPADTTHLIDLVKSYEPKKYKGKVPREFYDNRGFYDFWRYPLVYPYSIGCIDVTDHGNIYSDEGRKDYDEGGSITPLSDYFDKFTFDRSHFVGNKCNSPFDRGKPKLEDEYFIFSFATGDKKNIKGIKNLREELKKIKFSGDTIFMTIMEYDEKL